MKLFAVARQSQEADLIPKKEAKAVSSSVENKKDSPQKTNKAFSLTALYDFIGEIKAELQRINWTSTDDLKTYVRVVVSVTFIFGMGIYGIDLIIQSILNVLRFTVHALFG